MLLILIIIFAFCYAVLRPLPRRYASKHMRNMSAKDKGKWGEQRAAEYLSSLCGTGEYILLNDIMLFTKNGTAQIDHILLSVYGIFVIETKNYTGCISGGDDAEYWSHRLGRAKYRFKNPFRQNYGHILALMELLEIKDTDKFTSIIAFSDGARINVNPDLNVAVFSRLTELIGEFREVKFTPSEIEQFRSLIVGFNIVSPEVRNNHALRTKQAVDMRNDMISQGICPRCGKQLVRRKGRYGEFIGCKGFPKCRFTADLN